MSIVGRDLVWRLTVEINAWDGWQLVRARRLRRALEADPAIREASHVSLNYLPRLAARASIWPSVEISLVADSPAAAFRMGERAVQRALDTIDPQCRGHVWIVSTEGVVPD